ncbi:hypothetical protein SARC_11177 [Sphaeroforma arctica JP610]|uniref:Uncharacterized protein n=1 Tax=Sphaeroforma arctica JP610 TaxID=667725 RepID=A0A0L0FJV2_9EUKA|nr:hypothetical protein SARC_11177 [Sphaeroforma arctica JP610]KNC76313.1 hypothetical protein SARC_11177 [Sphaeroforma arctica JP610]|eukprot:XP_014150215.1 hypothetical protein SARC_11177 [Sphaeroforma arctica JP610]
MVFANDSRNAGSRDEMRRVLAFVLVYVIGSRCGNVGFNFYHIVLKVILFSFRSVDDFTAYRFDYMVGLIFREFLFIIESVGEIVSILREHSKFHILLPEIYVGSEDGPGHRSALNGKLSARKHDMWYRISKIGP